MDKRQPDLVQPSLGRWLVQRRDVLIEQEKLKSHVLKVLDVGDYHRKEVKPQIRLEGKWLAGAGIQPGNFVKITSPQPGILVIECLGNQA